MSWHSTGGVRKPRVMMGTPDDGLAGWWPPRQWPIATPRPGSEVRVHHARLAGLEPDTDYVYAAFQTGPVPNSEPCERRRVAGPRCGSPASVTSRRPRWTHSSRRAFGRDNRGSPAAGDITTAVERTAPLFNLVNGDLCYANLAGDRVRTWSDWFENNSRSARYRPWMPAAGNHENELGNGPIGYGAYQTYFALPDPDSDPELRGLWYAFTAGSVRVISLQNDDICYQDGGNSYVRGYSGGAQKRWLERELERTRSDTRHRLGGGVHAPDGGVDGRAHQRRRPRHPGELAAAVRPLRRGFGGLRP